MNYRRLDRTKLAKYQLPRLDPNNAKSEYYFTPELEKKFRKLYSITSNIMLMSLFGVSSCTISRLAARLGLEKNMRVIRKKAVEVRRVVCEENGYYDSLRGKPLSENCYAAMKKKREEEGWHPLHSLKKTNPYRYRKAIASFKTKRREMEQKDALRVKIGLPQITRYHRPSQPFSPDQTKYRYRMLKHGYILGDMSEYSGERYTIFYDSETPRSKIMESRASKLNFVIRELT